MLEDSHILPAIIKWINYLCPRDFPTTRHSNDCTLDQNLKRQKRKPEKKNKKEIPNAALYTLNDLPFSTSTPPNSYDTVSAENKHG